MTIPVLLVTGFLGAGKTTLVNDLLRDPGGRRIAAVVNDFGSLDVDASLLGLSADGVVSLANGCICCSLEGDLIRTLRSLTRREPAPDAIVVETSGASDPAAIVRSLLDPVIFAVTPLDTVVTVVDAREVTDRPALLDDPLWRSQLQAADFVVLGKTDLVEALELGRVRADIARFRPGTRLFDAIDGAVPPLFLFAGGNHSLLPAGEPRPFRSADRFQTTTWSATAPLSLARFQAAIGRLTPHVLRAKGFVVFEHRPDQPMLFQLVGARATIVPISLPRQDGFLSRLVLIAEIDSFDPDAAAMLLDSAASEGPPAGGRPAVIPTWPEKLGRHEGRLARHQLGQ